MRKLFITVLLFVISCQHTSATTQTRITSAEARNYIGQSKTVCGKVASAKYSTSSRRKPTFLNLDEPYPRQIFTIVIWENDRAEFGEPEKDLLNNDICITGKIETYRSKPQIVLKEKSQLRIQ